MSNTNKNYEQDLEQIREEAQGASQEWIAEQYKAEVDRWGYIDPARWDLFYQWLTDNGLSEEPIAPGTGFTNDYLPE